MFSASKPWAAIDMSSSISQNGLKIGSKRPVISFSTRTESYARCGTDARMTRVPSKMGAFNPRTMPSCVWGSM